MKIFAETEQLLLRELLATDDAGMFELDSNPEVHRYLGNNPINNIEQARTVIAAIRQQYSDYGIGRWAVIEKATGDFVGWSGLKYITEMENGHIHHHDVGYRLIPRYWGRGYATETAKAAIAYGFTQLNLNEIIGCANIENTKSRKVLEKCGLSYVEQFMWRDIPCDWLRLTRTDWEKIRQHSTK
jgi:RimJ/RimL family protein N-acetyltransferase